MPKNALGEENATTPFYYLVSMLNDAVKTATSASIGGEQQAAKQRNKPFLDDEVFDLEEGDEDRAARTRAGLKKLGFSSDLLANCQAQSTLRLASVLLQRGENWASYERELGRRGGEKRSEQEFAYPNLWNQEQEGGTKVEAAPAGETKIISTPAPKRAKKETLLPADGESGDDFSPQPSAFCSAGANKTPADGAAPDVRKNNRTNEDSLTPAEIIDRTFQGLDDLFERTWSGHHMIFVGGAVNQLHCLARISGGVHVSALGEVLRREHVFLLLVLPHTVEARAPAPCSISHVGIV